MFQWGVAEELVPPDVYQAIAAVRGLRKGRTEAREPLPVKPVAPEIVEATLPHLPQVVADMVRFQRLTGARPGEVCQLRPMDIDQSKLPLGIPAAEPQDGTPRPRPDHFHRPQGSGRASAIPSPAKRCLLFLACGGGEATARSPSLGPQDPIVMR